MAELTQVEQDYNRLLREYDELFDQAVAYKKRAEKAEAEAAQLRETLGTALRAAASHQARERKPRRDKSGQD